MHDMGAVYGHGTLCIADDRILVVVSDLTHIPSSFCGALWLRTGIA
jgi:predicted metallopeptidase